MQGQANHCKSPNHRTISLWGDSKLTLVFLVSYKSKITFSPTNKRILDSDFVQQYAPEEIPYGIKRYQNETKRLYGVLDKHLQDTKGEYLVGKKATIADIAHWGWISAAGWAGVEIDEFPHLKAWEERMWARPALKKGANVPDRYGMKELLQDKEAMVSSGLRFTRAKIQRKKISDMCE